MATSLEIVWAIVLFVVCAAAWALNLIALPGNWIAVVAVALYAWLGPAEGRVAIGWPVAAAAFGFAAVGEALEFLAAALGAQRAGASRRTTLYALVGSMVGAVLGAVFGLPIPVVGPIIAALLFGALGAMGGALYAEWTDGRSWQESWPVAHAAFWGRLLGTAGKIAAGLLVILLVLLALVF
ncbi:DUF456 domain-containing protein [Roseimaritima sediminicola]|uniref:DUF456 domain-containing protein n=1 Tax=Roseimaritima sediminicola TaxID=2662066 RepID=UPI001F273ACF|nr:DUF456 domain-containing protein [Roseimaritima sediminicola]